MDAAPAAIPPNPNIAAIMAMTRNVIVKRNIIFSFWFLDRLGKNDATEFSITSENGFSNKKLGYRSWQSRVRKILWVVGNNMSNYFYVPAAYFLAFKSRVIGTVF
jgi:hypothetical protein